MIATIELHPLTERGAHDDTVRLPDDNRTVFQHMARYFNAQRVETGNCTLVMLGKGNALIDWSLAEVTFCAYGKGKHVYQYAYVEELRSALCYFAKLGFIGLERVEILCAGANLTPLGFVRGDDGELLYASF